jgi:hypothetical protein
LRVEAKQILFILAAVCILLLPLLLYIYQFGFSLSTEHSRWSEFGSYLTGIYSPVIALVALFILANQLLIQRSMGKHQHDQAFVNSAREDINFYIGKLENYLEKDFKDGVSIKDYIDTHFRFLDSEALTSQGVIAHIQSFNKEHQYIFDIWLALYPILKGLEASKSYPYEHNFEAAKLRISSCLSFGTCAAIDNIYYVISRDCNNGKYYYTDAI